MTLKQRLAPLERAIVRNLRWNPYARAEHLCGVAVMRRALLGDETVRGVTRVVAIDIARASSGNDWRLSGEWH